MINLVKLANYCGFGSEGERRISPKYLLDKEVSKETKGAVLLADLLPYDYFDESSGLFFNNAGSPGFFFEIYPLVGSNEGLEKNLTLFFNDELPENMYLQFLIIAGHDVSSILDLWENARIYGGKSLSYISGYRKDFIKKCASDFARAGEGRLARNYRTFVSCSTSVKSNDKIIDFKKKLENKLRAEKFYPRLMKAEDLIMIGEDLLQPDFSVSGSNRKYSKYNNLSDQICKNLTEMEIEDESIIYPKRSLESRIFSPKEMPDSFSFSEMVSLLGGDDKVIPARFVISYNIASCLGKSGTSSLVSQGVRSIHAAEKDYTRHDISAKEEAYEWREILDLHKKGERFLSESMQVMITAPKEEIEIAEESLKSLWNSYDWKLSINNKLQLVTMLSMLPCLQSFYWKSLSFFKLTRNALSPEVVAKLPLQGEWRGVPRSGVLMLGRRGQLFNFNPFYRIGGGGNYNIAMMAPSGSGKSFFLQELATSLLAQDVALFIMDIGGSYQEISDSLGGELIRFDKNNKLSLNPFASLSNSGAAYQKALSMLDQGMRQEKVAEITGLTIEKIKSLLVKNQEIRSLEDSIEIIEIKGENKNHFVTKDSIIYAKSMLSSMCGVSGDPRFEAIMERSIVEGIRKYGEKLDVTRLSLVLENMEDKRGNLVEGASKLADSLYPYTEQGIHGRYFSFGREASFKELLTIFEFEEIKDDEPLLAVILQIILMQITMQFLCGDRSRYFMLIVDEAWMIMDFAADFLERFARTVRKYGGSLVVCTQDLSSFNKGVSQKAILESCSWKLILQQKEEGIASFAKEEGYKSYLDLIRSIRKCSENKFSEILIDTNGTKVVGRLAVDPYSTAIYSTEKDDFNFLRKQEKQGIGKHEALLELSKKYGNLLKIND